MVDPRMAATAAHFAAVQSSVSAATAPVVHADVTHLNKSTESSIDGTCTSSVAVGGGASIVAFAETAAARDMVPVDPEPAEHQQQHLQLVDSLAVAPIFEQRPMMPPNETRGHQNVILAYENVQESVCFKNVNFRIIS